MRRRRARTGRHTAVRSSCPNQASHGSALTALPGSGATLPNLLKSLGRVRHGRGVRRVNPTLHPPRALDPRGELAEGAEKTARAGGVRGCDTRLVRVAVVGGGIAGLTFSLLAARAGHEVVVVDRDPPRDGGEVDSAWERWDRRSVPQFRQIHGYQALAHAVLRERLPDVFELLHRVGAHDASRAPAVPGADSVPGSDAIVQFQCRRSTLEWVLRAAATGQEGIDLREGTEAKALITLAGPTPRVRGVRTTAGDVTVDLVVDAGGRRSQSGAWLAAERLPAAEQMSVATRQVYFTRWFRGRDSSLALPSARVELSFATLMIYPADAGWFSVTFFASADDAGLRTMLLDRDRLVTAARAVPPAAELLNPDLVEPQGEVLFMGRLSNHLRIVPASNQVAGMVSLADAVVCTNPTWGRGVTLALANAAALADLLGEVEEPASVSRDFTQVAATQLEPWYHDTVFLDAEVNALWSGARNGLDVSGASSGSISLVDALAAAQVDPVVSVAYARYRNLLDPPSAFWADEHIVNRVRAAVAGGAPPVTLHSPSRSDFDALF
jgi:2-polyprenyl-6-methoxyphenol hydroxylase-like FAD-dependent oxidoreductase